MTDQRLLRTINALLNDERRRLECNSDRELAARLGVSAKSISLWRSGRSLSPAARVMLKLVAQSAEDSAGNR